MLSSSDLPRRFAAVIFDLDGTLRHDAPSETETSFDFAVKLGAQDSPELRRSALEWVHYYWAQSPELAEDLKRFDGQLSQDFWVLYTGRSLEQLGCSSEQAKLLAPQVLKLMDEEYTPEDLIIEDVHTTLNTLKNKGLRLGVVSNRSRAFCDVLDKHNLTDYFDLTLAAGEINTWKPDPRIFTYAANSLQIEPGDALYVGDNYYADFVGARQAGMVAVLFDPRQIFVNCQCPRIERLSELLLLVK
jgi:HAD superfamily hydrolase (TIGR01549 family)